MLKLSLVLIPLIFSHVTSAQSLDDCHLDFFQNYPNLKTFIAKDSKLTGKRARIQFLKLAKAEAITHHRDFSGYVHYSYISQKTIIERAPTMNICDEASETKTYLLQECTLAKNNDYAKCQSKCFYEDGNDWRCDF